MPAFGRLVALISYDVVGLIWFYVAVTRRIARTLGDDEIAIGAQMRGIAAFSGREAMHDTPKEAKNGDSKPGGKFSSNAYLKELRRLHGELVKMQEWVVHSGAKICVVFEGRDGAGKGGTIKAITERVSPRIFRVIALPAPTDREKSQMYMQRYVPHLPAAGEVVIFDRSWYNRAGVERVMGFCTEREVQEFLFATPLVERAIIDSGVILVKYWLEVSPEEQTRRLEARIYDERKVWKLSPMDVESYRRWYDYSKARDEMFAKTDTEFSPWYIARSDDKKRARLNIIRHLLSKVPYESVPREHVKLPRRQNAGDYREPDYPYRFVPVAAEGTEEHARKSPAKTKAKSAR
jgi:polyphosphate kinase 2